MTPDTHTPLPYCPVCGRKPEPKTGRVSRLIGATLAYALVLAIIAGVVSLTVALLRWALS